VSKSTEDNPVNITSARTLLDDAETYTRLDRSHMQSLMASLGTQIRQAWTVGQNWPLPPHFHTPDRVVIIGMGGSAIGADIVATIARRESTVPVDVIRNYAAPPSTKGTLTLANSFSGNTEETLAAFEESRRGPGMRMTISTGGELAKFDDPHLSIDWDGPPRSALGWNLFPALAVLSRLGVLSLTDDKVDLIASALTDDDAGWGSEFPSTDNFPKQIAISLHEKLPIIVGVDFLEVAARRWAGQIQENAKQWAFWSALPEMNHNFLNGFGLPTTAIEQMHTLLLDAKCTHPRNHRRVELTADALTNAGVHNSRQVAAGESPLEAVVRACHLGDWVSYYLAMLNGADPTEMQVLEEFKQQMNGHTTSD